MTGPSIGVFFELVAGNPASRWHIIPTDDTTNEGATPVGVFHGSDGHDYIVGGGVGDEYMIIQDGAPEGSGLHVQIRAVVEAADVEADEPPSITDDDEEN